MIENKNIVYLVTQSKFGGAQRYVLDLAHYFSASNKVTLVIGNDRAVDPNFLRLAQEYGLPVKILHWLQRDIGPIKNLLSIWEIKKLLKELQPDILHINSSMAGFIASCSARWYNLTSKKKVKVIYTAHGFVFNEPLPAWKKNLYVLIEKISAHWKDAIITVSDFDRNSGQAVGIKPRLTMTTVHNGVDKKNFTFIDRKIARETLGLPLDATIIGSIASLYLTKGLTYLIEAISNIKSDNKLCVVISFGGPQEAELNEIISQLNLKDKFLILNGVYETRRYLKAFDIYVMSSVKEGLPYTLLEAGLANLPTIATQVGGVPEIIDNQVNGLLVPPADSQALADGLQRLLENPEQSQRWGLALGEKIRSQFSLEAMCSQTNSVYLASLGIPTMGEK